MPAEQTKWTREQLTVTLDLYCRTPFGRLHRGNPDVIALAKTIGRTPSAVAMKLVNFASFDPTQQRRGIHGLSNAGREDRRVWEEFENDWEALAIASATMREHLGVKGRKEDDSPLAAKRDTPTEATRETKIRLVQGFFRDAVLASYDFACSFCGLCLAEMLTASHIVPWSCDEAKRADPRNGIALCAFHDRAFDRGLVTVRCDMTIWVSNRVKIKAVTPLHQIGLLDMDGKAIRMPARFAPDPAALEYHNTRVFR
jgi:putative restriction endonuclease